MSENALDSPRRPGAVLARHSREPHPSVRDDGGQSDQRLGREPRGGGRRFGGGGRAVRAFAQPAAGGGVHGLRGGRGSTDNSQGTGPVGGAQGVSGTAARTG